GRTSVQWAEQWGSRLRFPTGSSHAVGGLFLFFGSSFLACCCCCCPRFFLRGARKTGGVEAQSKLLHRGFRQTRANEVRLVLCLWGRGFSSLCSFSDSPGNRVVRAQGVREFCNGEAKKEDMRKGKKRPLVEGLRWVGPGWSLNGLVGWPPTRVGWRASQDTSGWLLCFVFPLHISRRGRVRLAGVLGTVRILMRWARFRTAGPGLLSVSCCTVLQRLSCHKQMRSWPTTWHEIVRRL
ncbi:hypothetical protein BGZ61DRAFT_458799, partial [Ilyonectria robusta]|uniref:uncharacterized protein n=1 Tax=Ilyonectria robusta TaxID=1079257 RepID=UPI001E8E4E78